MVKSFGLRKKTFRKKLAIDEDLLCLSAKMRQIRKPDVFALLDERIETSKNNS